MKNSNFLYLILIILIALFGIKALFHPGFYTSHDGEHQLLRLYYFDRAVRDGQIPPRWADNQILNGYGYPLFNFSYHLPWIIAESFRLAGLSLTTCVKVVFILTFLFSGIFMFFWVKKIFGKLPAFTASILYLWAPYRFSNIFVRASLGEAVALMFVPLIFLGIDKLGQKKVFPGILLGGFGLAGLILSHAMAFFIFSFAFLSYILVKFFLSKNKLDFAKRFFLMSFLGFSLSAYYTLPAFFEKKYTKFSSRFSSIFADHFVTLKQLIYSRWGYGFSFPGTENDGMAFQVGVAHWLTVFLSCLLLIFIFWKRGKNNSLRKNKVFQALIFIVSFLFSLLMMLKVSSPLWEKIVVFIPFDFPWRFLGLSIFSSSVLAGFGIWFLRKFVNQKISLLTACFLLLLNFYSNRNHLRVNQYTYQTDSDYEKITNTTTMFNEYLPIWAKEEFFEKETELVTLLRGEAKIKKVMRKSDKISLEVEAEGRENRLRVNSLFFPGWQLFINGKKQKFDFVHSGMFEFNLPVGHFQVLLIFNKTPIRIIGEVISFSSLIFLFLWSLKFQWR